jgi:hypothetical protein
LGLLDVFLAVGEFDVARLQDLGDVRLGSFVAIEFAGDVGGTVIGVGFADGLFEVVEGVEVLGVALVLDFVEDAVVDEHSGVGAYSFHCLHYLEYRRLYSSPIDVLLSFEERVGRDRWLKGELNGGTNNCKLNCKIIGE